MSDLIPVVNEQGAHALVDPHALEHVWAALGWRRVDEPAPVNEAVLSQDPEPASDAPQAASEQSASATDKRVRNPFDETRRTDLTQDQAPPATAALGTEPSRES